MELNPNKLRKHILYMVYKKQSGHIGGSFSLCEVVSHLYSKHDLIEKDKLILSKGHAVPVIYAVLYEMGLIDSLDDFREIDSKLQGHPHIKALEYIHATTGSLGQGLSIAIGYALGYKLKNMNNKVFCILGDGELQEGQNWEAFMYASTQKLDNLVCFIDFNHLQSEGRVKGTPTDLWEKLHSFGWHVKMVDGHNLNQIENSLVSLKKNVPACIILNTVKGKGVSFMENDNKWHSKFPNEEEYNKALGELNEGN